MTFSFKRITYEYLLAIASLIIQITTQNNGLESQYVLVCAAARYDIATYIEVIAPAAVDPVSHWLRSCAALSAILLQLRAVHPSPQLEFAFISKGYYRPQIFQTRGSGQPEGKWPRLQWRCHQCDEHRLLHGLLAIDTVLQVTCESFNSSCRLPVSSRTSRTRTRRDVPSNENNAAVPIPTGTADQSGDALDEDFDVFDENDYTESGQLEAAEKTEQREDSDETEIKIDQILFHKPGGTRADARFKAELKHFEEVGETEQLDDSDETEDKPSWAHAGPNSGRLSFERRLARVRCIVLELNKRY